MDKQSSTTLKAQVYDSLFSDIITGIYSVDTILTEKFLMEKYQISRAPIREALTQLIGKHILESIPRQGYKILEPSREQLLEIIRFRSSLESSFLENYSIYIDKTKLHDLRAICELYTACPDNDFMTHWHYNCQFHLKLFSIYGNHYAYKLLEDALNIQTIFFVQKRHFATMDLHLAIIDYIERGDISTAITILKADIENLLLPIGPPPPVE